MSHIPIYCPVCDSKLIYQYLFEDSIYNHVLNCSRTINCISFYIKDNWVIDRLSFYHGDYLFSYYQNETLEILDKTDPSNGITIKYKTDWLDLDKLMDFAKTYVIFS